MAELAIDYEKLEYGLTKGIGKTSTIYASVDEANRLRITPCGMVSTALHYYCLKQGLKSQLLICSPQLSFDPEMQHCLSVVNVDKKSTALDACYSNLLCYSGIQYSYIMEKQFDPFPREKLISFNLNETETYIDWITDVISTHQKQNVATFYGFLGRFCGDGHLSTSSRNDIRETYSAIYDFDRMVNFYPEDYVIIDGLTVAESIPSGAISA